MRRGKKRQLMEKLSEYIHKKIWLCQDLPGVFADRVLKLSILSFLIFSFGTVMGIQMESMRVIFWTAVISIILFAQAFLLLRTALLGNYEVVEGVVLEISEKNPLGKLRKVRVRLPDDQETVLLLPKTIHVEKGCRYRFYFNSRLGALSGIKTVDAALNTGSFYGFEKSDEG